VIGSLGLIVAMLVIAEGLRIEGDASERGDIAAFYAQPSGAADGAPGTLVKAEALSGTPLAARAWRIMYRSTTAAGDPVVVTGVVVTPIGAAPPGGRRVMSWAHPTTGAAAECAPSYGFDPFLGIEGMRLFLDRGYTVVATDYAGMGTDGPDSYLIGGTEANNVLDAVRAARSIPESQAGSEIVLWGHSQGGQAALFAAERATTYAPELQLAAVAVAAPAADLTELMGAHLDDISGVTIGSYAFTSFAQTYGGTIPGASLESILTPAALAVVPRMNDLCLLTNLDELHRMGQPLVGDFLLSDPTATEPWQTLLADNSAGSTAFDAPLFVAQGGADQLIVPEDTARFVDHERSIGIDATLHPVGVATHSTIAYLTLPALDLWLAGHGL
jgi:pimeloyl-ACP methyl ester carboxylesterase